ncbi:MAG: hypothetical protein ACRC11_18735 [Xenococcaceae cyanobacterium]
MPHLTKQDEDWIEKYGSDYLQRLLELGLNCRTLYIEERAAIEFPSFQVTDKKLYPLQQHPSKQALIIINNYPQAFASKYCIGLDTIIYKEIVALKCPFSDAYLFKPIKKDRTAPFRRKFKQIFECDFGEAALVTFLVSSLVVMLIILGGTLITLKVEVVTILAISSSSFLSYIIGNLD